MQMQDKENMLCSLFFLTFVCFSDRLRNFIVASGDQYSLECVNDYLFTITCYVNISAESPSNESSWLQFSANGEYYNCTLKDGEQSLVCVLVLSPDVSFTDTDSYRISLHSSYHGNNFSVVLDGDYMPKEHIRPVSPYNLSLHWEKDVVVFQWDSGYDPDILLIHHLQYQLSLHKEHQLYEVEVMDQNMSVDISKFEPCTSYTARVRSRPNQEYYKGVWGQWTPALHWRSGHIHKTPERSFQVAWYLLLLPLPLFLLTCIPYSRWRKRDYIPSPAPYLKDWNLDVQICTLLSGELRNIMQGEESLQIDILTESPDTPPQPTTLTEMMEMTSEPMPQSFSIPHSLVGSEVDSGCWIRDITTTESGSITCSEDYCPLSQHTYGI
ncbi:interleukin-4 receptor subunit alpha-like isoform X1 [Myxocyprinus asiaticus]|uniref:interleukin-4 receptor subunit alpha-like isoform X1 n=2 Tax=Myxocyprinus asiaticus TaxID=70543 RepID=UPI002221D3E8|nr:interleukin-4 receptor subunit alpha-like isoform X1 [Myxocyprinus asiaticus]